MNLQASLPDLSAPLAACPLLWHSGSICSDLDSWVQFCRYGKQSLHVVSRVLLCGARLPDAVEQMFVKENFLKFNFKN